MAGKPRVWSKAVRAAAERLLGATQADAAAAAGVRRETVVQWEKADWWPDAVREADVDWMGDLMALARKAVTEAVREGDANLGLKILERSDPRFREQKRLEVSTTTYRIEMPEIEVEQVEAEVLSVKALDDD